MFTRSLLNLLIISILLLTACVDIPDPKIELLAASLRDLRVEFASDPQMLARIDAVTALLEKGVKAGFDAETLAALGPFAEELTTIELELSKGGLNPELLQRLDVALEKMDRMLTIRVDEPTRSLFLKVLEDLRKYPELWRESVAPLIPLMGDEIEDVISKAEASSTNLISILGVEGRCNVDFWSVRINDSIPTFISKNLQAILEKVWKTGERPDLIPTPVVCHVEPAQIDLLLNGETFIPARPIRRISGWDLSRERLPTNFYLLSADGQVEFPLPAVRPLQLSLYEFQINLQAADLGQAGRGSSLVFEWPGLDHVKIELPIVFPPDPTPTPSPLPQPIISVLKDNTPIYYYPCTWCWRFAYRNNGDQLRAISYLPDCVMVKVDVEGTLGYVYIDDVELNVPLDTLQEDLCNIPTPQPTRAPVCSFDATPRQVALGESVLVMWDVEGAARVELSYNGKLQEVPEHKRVKVSPTQTITYTLIVTDTNNRPVNCSPGNSVTITVAETPVTSVPATLTPPPQYPSDLVSYYRFENLGGNVDKDTGIPTDQYVCGVAGFSTGNAKIDSNGVKGSVFDLFAYHHAATNTWWIRADFTTEPYSMGVQSYPDTENWAITLLCLNKGYPDLIMGWGYNFGSGEYRANTGISVQDYACGIFGFYIRNGDLNENEAGDILSAYLFEEGGTYHAYLNFRTHEQEPERAISALCIKKLNPDQLILDHYPSIGDNPDWSTRYGYDPYVCVPAGYAILGGDMNEKEPGVIINLNTYRGNDNNWWIRGDVHSHHTDENWSVDLLCLSRSMAVGAP